MNNTSGNTQVAYEEVMASFDDTTDEFIFADDQTDSDILPVFRSRRREEAQSRTKAVKRPVPALVTALA